MVVTAPARLRVAEALGVISFATDLGLGQDFGQALTGSVVASRLAESLGFDEKDAAVAYHVAVLNLAGCTADAHTFAHYFGDELDAARRLAPVDFSRPAEALPAMLGAIRPDRGLLTRAKLVASLLTAGQGRFTEGTRAHCEVAGLLAARLGFAEDVRLAVAQAFARWDGKGQPKGLGGEELSPGGHVAQLAIEVAVHHTRHGVDGAAAMARRRAGTAFDPDIAEHFAARAPAILADLGSPDIWTLAMASEPGQRRVLTGDDVDEALRAWADFADLKSAFFVGHSTAVADLAANAAAKLRLPASDVTLVRQAAWLHDLGRVGVPVNVWDKPGPLSHGERERVRLHAYYTERIVSQCPTLAVVASVAGRHHERLNGSGYHRGCVAAQLSPLVQVLASADAFRARTERRPYRPPVPPEQAASELRGDARAGLLNPEVVEAVVETSGQPARRRRTAILGLTTREIEVLRLLANGHTVKEVARTLVISDKTADSHVQHIYSKLGVSTRAAATVLAMQHGILEP